MEVQQIVLDVAGEVLQVESFLRGQAGLAENLTRGRKDLRGCWKRPARVQGDHAIVNCLRRGAGELLENDRPRQGRESFRAVRYAARTDFGNNLGQNRIRRRKVLPCGARIWCDRPGRHGNAPPTVSRPREWFNAQWPSRQPEKTSASRCAPRICTRGCGSARF